MDLILILSPQGVRSIQTSLITSDLAHLGGGVTLAGIACHVKGVNNWPLSCNSEMAGPIVTKFAVSREQAAVHIKQIMGTVHPHLRTCRCASAVSRKRPDGLR